MKGWASRNRVALVIGLVVAGVIGSYAASRGVTTAASAVASESPTPIALTWSAGSDHTYDLRWSGSSVVHLPGAPQPIDVDVDLDATLVVRAVRAIGGVNELVVSLSVIRTYDVRMQGKPMFDDRAAPAEKAAIVGQAVFVRMDARGAIVGLGFDPATPPRVRQLLERIVEATRITLPAVAAASWEAEETTPTGTCKVRYRKGDGSTIARERVAYTSVTAVPSQPGEIAAAPQHVSGGSTITIDSRGALTSLRDSEKVTIDVGDDPYRASSSLTLTRRSVTPFDPSSVDTARFTEPHAPFQGDATKSDESIVGNVTRDSITTTVIDFERGAKLDRGFMVRASAYGRLHPDSTRALVPIFLDATTGTRSRTLVMDLLSATGDATAQEAMVTIVRSTEARADVEAFSHYVQRFMLVERPAHATAAAVVSLYEDAKSVKAKVAADAIAVPLGALAKKLVAAGDGLGETIHATLRADLEAATTDATRIALLKALGNGAFDGDDAVIATYAASRASRVRDQAAFSLRRIDSPLSRATLFTLAQDPNQNVAVTAVRALKMQSLSPDEWSRFRDLVVAGKTSPGADSAIVSLIGTAASRPSEDEARPILIAISARNQNADLHDEIEGLLAQKSP